MKIYFRKEIESTFFMGNTQSDDDIVDINNIKVCYNVKRYIFLKG